VGDVLTPQTSKQELVNLIVGKDFSELYPSRTFPRARSFLR